MNFKQMAYFLMIAEEGSFSKAAQRLFISQQALSESISNLEKEYGVQFFQRKRPLVLTPAGVALQRSALKIIKEKKQLEQFFQGITQEQGGIFKFGTSIQHSRYFLSHLIPLFKKDFPNVEVRLMQDHQYRLNQLLAHGDIDLIIGFDSFDLPDIHSTTIGTDLIYLIVPRSIMEECFRQDLPQAVTRLSHQGTLQDFADRPFLLTGGTCKVRKAFNSLCEQSDIHPTVAVEAQDASTLLQFALDGMGIAVVSQFLLLNFKKDILEQRSIYAFPLFSRKMMAGYYSGYNYLPPFVHSFINDLQILCETGKRDTAELIRELQKVP